MRGEILQYNDQSGAGLISGDDGVQYTFTRGDLLRLVPIKPRDRVDFVGTEGRATEITLLQDVATQFVSSPAGAVNGPPQSSNEDLTMWGYFGKCMRLYVDGKGRARRKEYWSFILFSWLIVFCVACVGAAIDGALGNLSGDAPNPYMMGALVLLSVVVFALPNICVAIRRFHDVGMSGWWYLLGLIPYVGSIFLVVISLIPSQIRVNKYGLYPKPWRV